jgi:uncharacterized protein (DUF3084 family)
MSRTLTPEEIEKLLDYDAKPAAEKAQVTRQRQRDAEDERRSLRQERDEAKRQLEEITERWNTLKSVYLDLAAARREAIDLLDPAHPAVQLLARFGP